MKIRPYKFTSLLSKFELDSLESKIDQKKYNPFDFLEFIEMDFHEDPIEIMAEIDEVSMLLLCDSNLVGIFSRIMKRFGLKLKIEDASEDIFNGTINISKFNIGLKEKIEELIFENYDHNHVLDKINTHGGIACLTEIDKKILENKKPA